MNVLVEGFTPEAIALARLLASEGNDVRIVGAGVGAGAAATLRERGIRVEVDTDLDADPGEPEIAYLDVWTPEVAPRVQTLRARGARISCLGDLLLERWHGPTIGITGTAGKTTTTSIVAEILRRGGIDVAVSEGARAGNLWPTADLLDRLEAVRAEESRVDPPVLLLELTSSHLVFMSHSPNMAAVISFWPDHMELHGGLARYRTAKETIVRHQRAADVVVVNADDASREFAHSTPAELIEFSVEHEVGRGAYLDPARGVVVVGRTGESKLGHIEAGSTHPSNILAAAAIAAAAGASPEAIQKGIRVASLPAWRAQRKGELAGVAVVDDGMAATPSKSAALLRGYPDGSVVLIAGGLVDAGGGEVHSAPEERALLEDACDEIARTTRACILFGPAAPRLERLLRERGLEPVITAELADAVTIAAREAPGAAAVVFSPLFPVSLDDRASFTALVDSVAPGTVGGSPSPGRP